MTDPLRLISGSNTAGSAYGVNGSERGLPGRNDAGGESFKSFLDRQLKEVESLQQEATQATNDLMTGKRTDFDSVLSAVKKADLAFKMTLQIRNKVIDAYNEIKQIRV